MSLIKKKINIDLLSWKNELIISQKEGKTFVLDPIRKKKILLQPEELVRQLMILWLIQKTDFNRNNIQSKDFLTKQCLVIVFYCFFSLQTVFIFNKSSTFDDKF